MSDTELERFKTEINLVELACSYGYELDRKESSRTSFVMRHQDGDKIVVATDTDGHSIFFSVRDDKQHGSTIDFVKWKSGTNLGQSRQILRQWIANSTPLFPTQKRQPLRPEPIMHNYAATYTQWLRMQPYNQAYGKGYLEKRGLSADTISRFSERIGIDEYGNTVFRHDDLLNVTGWEIKNRGFTGFSRGGKKALFGCKIGLLPQKLLSPLLVFTESAIDVMSYYQLNPNPGFYLSFAGSMSLEQHNLLKYVLNRYPDARIITATDNDPQGERFADMIRSIRPDATRAIPPIGKDWNDALNHQFIIS
jgi:hypothetical protein